MSILANTKLSRVHFGAAVALALGTGMVAGARLRG